MNIPKIALLSSLLFAAPAYAKDAGIQFDKMKIGTTLITQSLSGKKRILSQKYVGKRGDFFVIEESWRIPNEATESLGNVFYDAKGREVRSERPRGEFIYTPFSCMQTVGECANIYDYPNLFTKKKNKRTKSRSRYINRIEGTSFYVTWKMADDSIAEVPFQLGPYNFRVSSEYKNVLGQVRGHKLIEIIEP